MGVVQDVTTEDFGDEVLASEVPVIVDFWAPWCGPCKMVGPELEKLSNNVGDRAKFVKVNIDENRELAMEYGVMSIPTIAKFEGGDVVTQIVGARGASQMSKEFGLE